MLHSVLGNGRESQGKLFPAAMALLRKAWTPSSLRYSKDDDIQRKLGQAANRQVGVSNRQPIILRRLKLLAVYDRKRLTAESVTWFLLKYILANEVIEI